MKTADVTKALRKLALGLPGVEEGISCAGTPIEKAAFRVKKRMFFCFGGKDGGFDVMVKLDASLAEARKLAAQEPRRYNAGAGGWTSAKFAKDEAPPHGLLERWIGESYTLFAAAAAPAGARTAKPAKTAKKTSKKR